MAIPHRNIAQTGSTHGGGQLAHLISDANTGRTSASAALPIAPNHPFFLMHWPGEWSVQTEGLERATWLPTLTRHHILPGCNLNRTTQRGEPPEAAYDMAVMSNVRKGATYLDPERHLLADGSKYLKSAPCRSKHGTTGEVFLDAWQIPLDTLPGKKLKFGRDRAAYHQWLLDLVTSGVIRRPSPRVLEQLVRRRSGHVGRTRARLRGLPEKEYERRVDEVSNVVEVWGRAVVPQVRNGASSPMLSSPGTGPDLGVPEDSE
jgi:hypothetical protein